MEFKMRETSCCGAVFYCLGLLFLVTCLFGGPVLLSKLAIPFRNYLSEEKHHKITTCTYQNYTYLGGRPCTYVDMCGDSTCSKEDTYPCILVNVTTGEPSSNNTATLYRTYQDADRTNFECSAYECEDGYQVITWVKELDDLMGFQCFYHPEDPHIVYMETATYWRVIALFVAALLMFVLGIWGLLVVIALFAGCRKLVYVLTCCMCCTRYSKSNKVWDRDVEERQRIISAIEAGDLPAVRKLVTPHNVNSALSKKQLFVIRTTTPLSHTASKGHLHILKHLITLGADVNKKNDARQTLLHCACISLSHDVVKNCLTTVNCDGMINCRDIYGCTPLLLFAKLAKAECSGAQVVDIAEALIKNGAHASWKCHDGCTALHYAILNSQRQLASFLIKGGCVDNTPKIDGSRTPLAALLLVKDAVNLKLLIEAGVQPRKDTQLQEVMSTASGLDPELLSLLQTELHQPAPLTRICRAVIRSSIHEPDLQGHLEKLRYPNEAPIPVGIIRFLQLDGL